MTPRQQDFLDYMQARMGEREFHEYKINFKNRYELHYILEHLGEQKLGLLTPLVRRGRPPKQSNDTPNDVA